MSVPRTTERLLRLYPASRRERYGDELEELIVQVGGGASRVPLRTQIDVAVAAGRERLRAAAGRDHGDPDARRRDGVLRVLWGWALMMVAGFLVQRASEHWQSLTPASSRALPRAAFVVLVAAAVVAALAVAAGIALALPAARAFLRDGGWSAVRRRVRVAVAMSGVAVVATAGLVAWARGRSDGGREGHDAAYAAVFVAWLLLLAATLASWTGAATATARRSPLRPATLRAETALAGAVAVAMTTVTTATAVWWIAVADAAPRFYTAAPLTAALAAMVIATLLAVSGVRRAVGPGRAA